MKTNLLEPFSIYMIFSAIGGFVVVILPNIVDILAYIFLPFAIIYTALGGNLLSNMTNSQALYGASAVTLVIGSILYAYGGRVIGEEG